jgi:transcriptional antiterminator Rof (Rho-off)
MENLMEKTSVSSSYESFGPLRQLGDVLELADLEWVILRMVYQDGVKLKAVAKVLQLKEHEPGRVIKRVLAKIADALDALGIDKDNFMTQLQ